MSLASPTASGNLVHRVRKVCLSFGFQSIRPFYPICIKPNWVASSFHGELVSTDPEIWEVHVSANHIFYLIHTHVLLEFTVSTGWFKTCKPMSSRRKFEILFVTLTAQAFSKRSGSVFVTASTSVFLTTAVTSNNLWIVIWTTDFCLCQLTFSLRVIKLVEVKTTKNTTCCQGFCRATEFSYDESWDCMKKKKILFLVVSLACLIEHDKSKISEYKKNYSL